MMTGYSWTGYGIYEAAQLAIPITFLKFSREFEAQADYLGVQYMYRAGYDPQAFISFFEKVQALEKRKPGLVAKAFSDHPQTPDRILHSQEEIARILPAKDEYTGHNVGVRRREGAPGAHREQAPPARHQGRNKPSLRRASTGPDDNGNSGSTGNSGSAGNSGSTRVTDRRRCIVATTRTEARGQVSGVRDQTQIELHIGHPFKRGRMA